MALIENNKMYRYIKGFPEGASGKKKKKKKNPANAGDMRLGFDP